MASNAIFGVILRILGSSQQDVKLGAGSAGQNGVFLKRATLIAATPNMGLKN